MKFREYLDKLRNDPEYAAAEEELRPILDIANDVLRLRLEKGWSQADLAEHVGTKQANISRLENGLANPSLEFLQRIAKALGTELAIRLGAQEADEHTKYIFLREIQQDALPDAEPRHSTEDWFSPGQDVYSLSQISFVSNTATKPERVAL